MGCTWTAGPLCPDPSTAEALLQTASAQETRPPTVRMLQGLMEPLVEAVLRRNFLFGFHTTPSRLTMLFIALDYIGGDQKTTEVAAIRQAITEELQLSWLGSPDIMR